MNHRHSLIPALLLTLPGLSTKCAAALVAGDLAIIGYQDNGAPDNFLIATLAPIAAGEVIYFTDNGWTGSGFRGASATDGDGNENLIALTIDAAIPAGTVLTSAVNTGAVTWTFSGGITGTTSGAFANLALGTGGDQITAFQGSSSNPLLNYTGMVFQVHNAATFTPATTSSETDIASGLSIAGGTVVHLPPTPAPDFLSGTFRLNTADPDVALLQTNGGTKSQWLSVIASRDNWLEGAAAAGSLNVAAPVPEPGSTTLGGLLAAGILLRRRK